jgi:hypothetical protein
MVICPELPGEKIKILVSSYVGIYSGISQSSRVRFGVVREP